jgi:hypothetical protein
VQLPSRAAACHRTAGAPSADELQKVRTRKPAPPVLAVQMAHGSTVPLWNTFTDQQVGGQCTIPCTVMLCVREGEREGGGARDREGEGKTACNEPGLLHIGPVTD